MPKPAIALYLGESYAAIGLFDISKKTKPVCLAEKSVFLPQVSLKNLLNKIKVESPDFFSGEEPIPVYIVTKYLDRLKQFRLGGSISQVILKGFENSYTMKDSKSLSLAAAQLIITVDPQEIDENFLALELERVKKINPDLNKVVISLPEESITAAQREMVHGFFSAAGLKIFNCAGAVHQSELRKTLLNAGSEGTKEEIVTDIKELLSPHCEISFFCHNGFQSQFENSELFNSSNNFLSHYLKTQNFKAGAYFDLESLKFIGLNQSQDWQSPWGQIPLPHYSQIDLSLHPFSEVKLNHLSILQVESGSFQLEPGPVVAGRAIRPLVLDLFYDELLKNEFAINLFTQVKLESLKSKIMNLFSVLEKGQKNPVLSISVTELKKVILNSVKNEIEFYANSEKTLLFGPMTDVFAPTPKSTGPFSWPHEIIKMTFAKDLK